MKPKILEDKIIELKKSFDNIEIRFNDIELILKAIDFKIEKLNQLYSNLIKNNKNNPIKIISLDSFNFQVKVIVFNFQNQKKYYNLISNRIYCDFYRLFNNIISYVKETIDENLIEKLKVRYDYPKYDFLNLFKPYEISEIKEIFLEAINVLTFLYSWFKMQKTEYKTYQMKNKSGIEIENILFTYEHNLVNISQKINFYCKFIEYFVKLHLKYLDRLLNSLKSIKSQIESDFELDETIFMKTEKTESSEIDNDYESESVGDDSVDLDLYSNKSPIKQNSFYHKLEDNIKLIEQKELETIPENQITIENLEDNDKIEMKEEIKEIKDEIKEIKEEKTDEKKEEIKDNLSVKSSSSTKSNKLKMLKINQ